MECSSKNKKIHRFDVRARFEGNHRSVGYGKKEEWWVKGRRGSKVEGGQRKKGRPKRTWQKQVEEESMKVGLRMEDALCRSKWSAGINQVDVRLR